MVLPDVDRSLVDHLERQVARVPGRVAVGDATRTLTYAQLDRAANHIARALLARSPAAEETVALLLGHEARMVEAMAGVLKAAKVFVPLDPMLPRSDSPTCSTTPRSVPSSPTRGTRGRSAAGRGLSRPC